MRSAHMSLTAALLLLATLLAPFQACAAVNDTSANSKTIVYGGDHNFPPYEYLDSTGKPQGFNVDMIRAIGQAMGLHIEVQLGPWANMRRRLEVEGTVHISDMFRSKQREAMVEFAEPFTIMHDQFYARRGSGTQCARGNLDGKEVIVEEASFTSEFLAQEEKGAMLIPAESEPAALRLLAAGKHDCALVTQIVGEEAIRRSRLTNLASIGPPIFPREYSLVVAKGNQALLDQINQGLAIIKATGQYSEIYDKWFGQSKKESVGTETILKYAAWVLIPSLLVVTAALLWSWSLRRVVAQRTADLLTELSERKRAEAELDYLAIHDPLTGLPNRHALYTQMGKWIIRGDGGNAFTLLLLDLDRFKEVNDTLGHQTGDHLLKQVGERLRGLIDERDLLARMGGDEFAILRPPASDTDTETFAQTLLATLDSAFEVAGIRLQVGASIGIAHFPQHGDDASTLIRHADVAMYISKKEMCGFSVYDPNRDMHNPERLAMMGEIKNVIAAQQLVLHYQPKIRLNDGKSVGVEALVRWKHPDHGLIYPDSFIPFVEMSDLIRPFTLWVIDHAMGQLRDWKLQGIHTTVSVNISARNLLDQKLAADIQTILARHEMNAADLELEITETAIMVDPARSHNTLDELAEIGVHISIDDFGIGYSSLSYLQKLPVHSLKIDRSFVTGMLHDQGAREIVASVIALAHNLELSVIAEGVEDQETEQALKQLGCDMAQGYYYSRPHSAEDIQKWWATNRA